MARIDEALGPVDTPAGGTPDAGAGRLRVLVAAAAAVLVVAVVAVALAVGRDDSDGTVLTPAGTGTDATTPTTGGTTPTTGGSTATTGGTAATTGGDTTATTGTPPGSGPDGGTGGAGGSGSGSAGAGCTTAGPGMPAGANSGRVPDVDGDGEQDTLWLARSADGGRPMGVDTSAGGHVEARVDSAAPIALRVLVADVDATPPVELLVSDGRSTQLWAFADCALVPVTDPAGEPYLFDHGLRGTGTGVGCVGRGDDRRLVGLNVVADDGTTVRWERTTIERDGLVADEGATESGTFTRPADDARIDLLRSVTCGDRTLAEDGIAQPE